MKAGVISCGGALRLLTLTTAFAQTPAVPAGIPHLEKQGTATRLIVDGKPFLMLAGELHNSSSSSLDYMRPLWPRLAAMPLNTVITPLAWELVEPAEGRFDFTLVDGLIQDARHHDLHLVFLWLASWKNGMSSYIPLWVKKDWERFPRVPGQDGSSRELLTALSNSNRDADARAFAALMRHIREVDGQAHTVLMMQVENEVGILGDSRDRSPAANEAFAGPVPKELVDYLQQHKDTLIPEFRKIWEVAGFKTAGTWEEVFGPGAATDEIFMAWSYARYVGHVAAAGRAEYLLPMYANAWLSQPYFPNPGSYPSGGPLAGLMDVWHAGAPAIDILAPDLYGPNFTEWCARYDRSGNPLFIPETEGGTHGATHVFYALGKHNAMGFSPFGIDRALDRDGSELGRSYAVLLQLAPLILEHQGRGDMTGFVLTKEHPSVQTLLGGYKLEISLDSIFGRNAESGYGLVIAVGPDQFVAAGSGFMVRFAPTTPGPPLAGLGAVEEGVYRDGKWISGRRFNGDEDDQGQHWRFSPQTLGIQRCTVYRFR
jgi:hypothetical protein